MKICLYMLLIVSIMSGGALFGAEKPLSNFPFYPDNNVNRKKYAKSITSFAYLGNRLYIGTDGGGLWLMDSPKNKNYQFVEIPTKNSELSIRCLKKDKENRLWVGTRNEGVWLKYPENPHTKTNRTFVPPAVAGKWVQLDEKNALVGHSVYAIETVPFDSRTDEFWVSTECGISRYNRNKKWSYLDGRHGLPKSAVVSIQPYQKGIVYVATAIDGVFKCDLKAKKLKFTPVQAKDSPQMINTLALGNKGELLVTTPRGFYVLEQGAKKWDVYHGVDAPEAKGADQALLTAEDYCMGIAPIDNDVVLVGHRAEGISKVNLATKKVVPRLDGKQTKGQYRHFLNESGYPILGGIYWHGDDLKKVGSLIQEFSEKIGNETPQKIEVVTSEIIPRSVQDAKSMIAEISKEIDKVKQRDTEYTSQIHLLPDDWRSQGDWLGRYGISGTILCAMRSPYNIGWGEIFINPPLCSIGPNSKNDDALRHWLHWPISNDKRVLEMPATQYDMLKKTTKKKINGNRCEAEFDDHGEVYARNFDGPHIYYLGFLTALDEVYSLYFMNPNFQEGVNNNRDYQVEMRLVSKKDARAIMALGGSERSKAFEDAFNASNEGIKTRVSDFGHGVYKRFYLRGGGYFVVKIDRNRSFNTILNGIFFDQRMTYPYPYCTEVGSIKYAVEQFKHESSNLAFMTEFEDIYGYEKPSLKGSEQFLYEQMKLVKLWNSDYWLAVQPLVNTLIIQSITAKSKLTEDDWKLLADCAKENINFSLWEESLKAQNYIVPRIYEQNATWDEGDPRDSRNWGKMIEDKLLKDKTRKMYDANKHIKISS